MTMAVLPTVHMTVASIVVATKVTISATLAGMTSRALNFKLHSYLSFLLFFSVESVEHLCGVLTHTTDAFRFACI